MNARSERDAPPAIGIDVGGTFTDFVAALPDGRQFTHKQPSTPSDPSIAVGEGLAALIAREPDLQGRDLRVVHGTTIGLNAILQRRIADVVLIVSQGHRDVLEIGRAKMKSPYDMHLQKEIPVVPRDLVMEVNARIDRDGKVLARPSEDELDALAARIRASGVEAVAILLLNAYIDPTLELELAQGLRARLGDLPVSASAEVWPEVREFERAVVTCINSQIHPLMSRYLEHLGGRIADAASAQLQLTSSSGGMLGLASAAERPVDTILSGPASGATAAARLCAEAAIPAAITFDMGGTSADIAVITEGAIEFTTSARVGELPLMMPVVGVNSIGAGGGSIVSVDEHGVIKVGPESAGANPGPVAYGLGGTRPTVTDCYLVLGWIDPAGFLGGRMRLDRAASQKALGEIAARLGLGSAEEAAEAALRVTTVAMAAELFKNLAQKGHDPADHVVIPFGGAGPTHSVMLAEEAGLRGVVVPHSAATFCALGAAVADLRRDFVRSIGKRRLADAGALVRANWEELEAQARAWIAAEDSTRGTPVLSRALDMQYAGQSYQLTVAIPDDVARDIDIARIAAAFHRAHHNIYGFDENDEAVEVVSQRLSISVPTARPPAALLPEGAGALAPRGHRPVHHKGALVEASVHRREDFGAGSTVQGPAVVEQDDTTLWLPPGWRASAHALGHLIVERT